MTFKKLSLVAASLATVVGLATSASAINPNGPVVKDPGPSPIGNWVGEYKYVSPFWGPDGRYYTYKYVQVSGTTQAYCQQQIPSSGVTITKYCTLTP